jgi:hypothetical protein
MHKNDRKNFKNVMLGRKNVYIYLKWAAVLLTLRTSALGCHGKVLPRGTTIDCISIKFWPIFDIGGRGPPNSEITNCARETRKG